jgi:hypothetical protein
VPDGYDADLLLLLACSETFLTPSPVAPGASETETVGSAEVSPLRINEVMARNDSTVMDEAMAFPDWVELYNPGDEAIDLATVTLEGSGATRWNGGGTIAAHGRVLLWADGQDAPGHLPFAISDEGERLTLAVDGIVCDRLATGVLAGDTALARFPDGGEWAVTTAPTPGWTNGSKPPGGTDPSDLLYDPAGIQTFDLTIPDTSWASLSRDPYTEVTASLGFRGAWFPEVGVRLKGVYGSLRSLDAKAAFKVDLNAYAPHRLRGVETLTLNNMVQDPSYTHETLAYALFRALDLPAPRTGWARLRVNGEDFGLYLDVETVDDSFLARWYENPDGTLYEGAYGVDLDGDPAAFEYDEGPDPTDRSDIAAVGAILNGDATDAAIAALDERVDMDQILDVMALEALLLHWDGYTTANNYRIYDDPITGRFQMIPWGTDQTFTTEYYGPYAGYGRLLTFCLENAGCSARYDAALLTMADEWEAADLEGQLDTLLAFLEPEVADDPRYEFDDATRQAYVDQTRATIRTSADRIRADVGAHR